MNLHALSPKGYQRSVVTALVHRIYRACSNWHYLRESLGKGDLREEAIPIWVLWWYYPHYIGKNHFLRRKRRTNTRIQKRNKKSQGGCWISRKSNWTERTEKWSDFSSRMQLLLCHNHLLQRAQGKEKRVDESSGIAVNVLLMSSIILINRFHYQKSGSSTDTCRVHIREIKLELNTLEARNYSLKLW